MTQTPPPHVRATAARRPPETDAWFVAVWLVSRTLMAWLWANQETFIDHDVRYYLGQLNHNGLGQALIEYPTPITLLLAGLRLLAGPSEEVFLFVFVLLMLALDGLATFWLWTGLSRWAAGYWLAFTFLVGSLIWFRIDLIPAVAVLAGLIWVTRRPLMAGSAIAIGAAAKLWPAMLIIPMLGSSPRARRRGLGFVIVGGVLGIGSLAGFGWQRSTSPLTWQSDRGLQIESLAATWPMIRHAFAPEPDFYTLLSEYNAWEIYGPGVARWQQLADHAMIGALTLALLLGWLIGLGGAGLPGHRCAQANSAGAARRRTHAIVLATIALICAVIVANKTFSPQYVIWLTGPLALLVALPLQVEHRRQARLLALLGLVTAALTHLVFPLNYAGLIAMRAEAGATLLLVGRNLIVVAMTILSILWALRAAWLVGLPEPEQTQPPPN